MFPKWVSNFILYYLEIGLTSTFWKLHLFLDPFDFKSATHSGSGLPVPISLLSRQVQTDERQV